MFKKGNFKQKKAAILKKGRCISIDNIFTHNKDSGVVLVITNAELSLLM